MRKLLAIVILSLIAGPLLAASLSDNLNDYSNGILKVRDENLDENRLSISTTAAGTTEFHIHGSDAQDGMVALRLLQGDEKKWGWISEYPTEGQMSFYSYDSASKIMVLDRDGNVGIGTVTPDHPLHVNGNAYVDGALFTGENGSNNARIYQTGNAYFNQLRIGKYGSAYVGDEDPFHIASEWGTGEHNLLIYGETDNATLHVQLLDGDLKIGPYSNTNATIYNTGNGYMRNLILGKNDVPSRNLHISKWDATKQIRLERRGNYPGFIEIGGDQYGFNVLSDDSERLFVVSPEGNVGIGVKEPEHKLHVDGSVYATEYLSEVNAWADHVFEPGYELRSLDDLSSFIKTHQHLPGVPSEKEVMANGVNLNDMQTAFLAKIEENVLYILELKSENEALSKRLTDLEARLERLEK